MIAHSGRGVQAYKAPPRNSSGESMIKDENQLIIHSIK